MESEIVCTNLTDIGKVYYSKKNYSVWWIIDRMGRGEITVHKPYCYRIDKYDIIMLAISRLKRLPWGMLHLFDRTNVNDEDKSYVRECVDGRKRLIILHLYHMGLVPLDTIEDSRYNIIDISALCDEYYVERTSNSRKMEIADILLNKYSLQINQKLIIEVNGREVDISFRTGLNNHERYRFLNNEIDFLETEGSLEDVSKLLTFYNIKL